MFGLTSLDVLIGLITVYLVLSLACTAIVEAISSWMSLRSKKLETALKEFLAGRLGDGGQFVEAFYNHPLVQALSEGRKGRPSYIPAEIVGKVVQSLITENAAGTSLKDAVAALPDAPDRNRIKGLLATFVAQGDGDLAAFRRSVETQFDAVMDRASGWVKRRQQMVTLIVSVVLVVSANVDTFTFATALSSSPELRTRILENAEQLSAGGQAVSVDEKQPSGEPMISGSGDESITAPGSLEEERRKLREAIESYHQARIPLEEAGLRFGWESMPKAKEWVAKISGLLISIFAISLGAPFWFDVLKRFMQVRQSGASPREKKN